jgi:hypothetical protein
MRPFAQDFSGKILMYPAWPLRLRCWTDVLPQGFMRAFENLYLNIALHNSRKSEYLSILSCWPPNGAAAAVKGG